MLRPGGETTREATLGAAGVIVCDPEHVEEALAAELPVHVLGGGAEPRDLPGDVNDMERIDPDGVEPRRWLLSAFGTATAASLTRNDTVYCLTPPSHPSGLLVGIGGAIAGGARFAMATEYSPGIFWTEVRRYGATVVTYTWRMLSDIVEAPPHPAEAHHPISLFVGAGMPPALWRRVLQRFDPALVVEFYTAPDAEAVLVNIGRGKIGSLGRPLPGTTRIRVAAWNRERNRLRTGPDGMAIPWAPGEVGMLLAEAEATARTGLEPALVRAAFAPDDAWVVTGDLAVRDHDGDIWLIDRATDVIVTPDGPRSPRGISATLKELDAVRAAAVYPAEVDGQTVAVAALELSGTGQRLPSSALDAVFADAAPKSRPDVVRVVDKIPLKRRSSSRGASADGGPANEAAGESARGG